MVDWNKLNAHYEAVDAAKTRQANPNPLPMMLVITLLPAAIFMTVVNSVWLTLFKRKLL